MAPKQATPDKMLEAARRLRADMTPAENELWKLLRGRQFADEKFRRQEVIGSYIVDFCSRRSHLIIELDGSVHDAPEVQEHDIARQAALEGAGYTILRFRNDDVQQRPENVLITICDHLKPRRSEGR
jgi:very-short-patch-repair endonuclease